MSTELYETLRGIVRSELEAQRTAELAVVQEQHSHESDGDADNYACSVVLLYATLVDVLNEMRDRERQESSIDLLRTYTVWRKTGSARAESLLRQHGVVPLTVN